MNDEGQEVNTQSRLTDLANSQPCLDLLFINCREVDLAWSQDGMPRDTILIRRLFLYGKCCAVVASSNALLWRILGSDDL